MVLDHLHIKPLLIGFFIFLWLSSMTHSLKGSTWTNKGSSWCCNGTIRSTAAFGKPIYLSVNDVSGRYLYTSFSRNAEPPIIFSQAMISKDVVLPSFSLSWIPFAINSAIKGKIFGPMAVVTKSASAISWITFSGFV